MHWFSISLFVLALIVPHFGLADAELTEISVSCMNQSLLSAAGTSTNRSEEVLLIADIDSFSLTSSSSSLRIVLRDCSIASTDVTIALFLPHLNSSSDSTSTVGAQSDGSIEVSVENSTMQSLRVVTIAERINRTRIAIDVSAVLNGDRTSLFFLDETNSSDSSDSRNVPPLWLSFPYVDEAKSTVASLLANHSATSVSAATGAPPVPLFVPLTVSIAGGSVIVRDVAVVDRSDWWSTDVCHYTNSSSSLSGGNHSSSSSSLGDVTLVLVTNATMWAGTIAGGGLFVNSSTIGVDAQFTVGNVTLTTYGGGSDALTIVVGRGATGGGTNESGEINNVSSSLPLRRAVSPSCWPIHQWWNGLLMHDVVLEPLAIAVQEASSVGGGDNPSSTSAAAPRLFSDLAPLWRMAATMSTNAMWRSFLSMCINNTSETVAEGECSSAYLEETVVAGRLANATYLEELWHQIVFEDSNTTTTAERLLDEAWSSSSSQLFVSPRFTSGTSTLTSSLLNASDDNATNETTVALRPSVVVASNISVSITNQSRMDSMTSTNDVVNVSEWNSWTKSIVTLFLPPRLALLLPSIIDTTTSSHLHNASTDSLFLTNTVIGLTVFVGDNSTMLSSSSNSSPSSAVGGSVTSVNGIAIVASPLDTVFGAWASGMVTALSWNISGLTNHTIDDNNATATIVFVGKNAVNVFIYNSTVDVSNYADDSDGSSPETSGWRAADATVCAVSIGLDMVSLSSNKNSSSNTSSSSNTTWLASNTVRANVVAATAASRRWLLSSSTLGALVSQQQQPFTVASVLKGATEVLKHSTLDVRVVGSILSSYVQTGTRENSITTSSSSNGERILSSIALQLHQTCAPRLLQQQGVAPINTIGSGNERVADFSSSSWDVCGGIWGKVTVTLNNATMIALLNETLVDSSHSNSSSSSDDVVVVVAPIVTSVGGVWFTSSGGIADLLGSEGNVSTTNMSISIEAQSTVGASAVLHSSFCRSNATNSSHHHRVHVAVGGVVGLVDAAGAVVPQQNSTAAAVITVWPFASKIVVGESSLIIAEVMVVEDDARNCSTSSSHVEWRGISTAIAVPYTPLSSTSVDSSGDQTLMFVIHPHDTAAASMNATPTTTVTGRNAWLSAIVNITASQQQRNTTFDVASVGVLCDVGVSCSITVDATSLNTTYDAPWLSPSSSSSSFASNHANIKLQNMPLLHLSSSGTFIEEAATTVIINGSSMLRVSCSSSNHSNSNTSATMPTAACANVWWLMPDAATAANSTASSSTPPTVNVTVAVSNATLIATSSASTSTIAMNFVIPHMVVALPVVILSPGNSSSENRLEKASSYGTVNALWVVENSTLFSTTSTVAPIMRSPLMMLFNDTDGGNSSTFISFPSALMVVVSIERCTISVEGDVMDRGVSGLVGYQHAFSSTTSASTTTTTPSGAIAATIAAAYLTSVSVSVRVQCSLITLGSSVSSTRALLFTAEGFGASVQRALQTNALQNVSSTSVENETSAHMTITSSLEILHSSVSTTTFLVRSNASNSCASPQAGGGILATLVPEAFSTTLVRFVNSDNDDTTFIGAVRLNKATNTTIDQRFILYSSVVNVTTIIDTDGNNDGGNNNATESALYTAPWIEVYLFDNNTNVMSRESSTTSTTHVSIGLDAVHVITYENNTLSSIRSSDGTKSLGLSVMASSHADAELMSSTLVNSTSSAIPFASPGTEIVVTPGSCVHTTIVGSDTTATTSASCGVTHAPLRVLTLADTYATDEAAGLLIRYTNVSYDDNDSSPIVAVHPASQCNIHGSTTDARVCASPSIKAIASRHVWELSCMASLFLFMDPIHTVSPSQSRRHTTESLSHSLHTPSHSATPTPGTPTSQLFSRSSRTPSRSASGTVSPSGKTSRASFSPTISLGSVSVRVISRSSRTPSVSINTSALTTSPLVTPSALTVTPSRSMFQSKSTRTPSQSVNSMTMSRSVHVSRSTRTPSVSPETPTSSSSRHVSKSTNTPTVSTSPLNNSTSPTLAFTPSNTTLVTRSVSGSGPTVSKDLNATATGGTQSMSPSASRTVTHTARLSSSRTMVATQSGAASKTNSLAFSRSGKSGSVSSSPQWSTTASRQTKTPLASQSVRLTSSGSPQPTSTAGITATKALLPTHTATFPLPREGEACLLPAFSATPSEEVDDVDVRLGDVVVWMNLTSPFRWAIDAPLQVSSGPLWTGSQPERSGWLHTVNLTCELYLGSKYEMRCTIPHTPTYKLLVEETVQFFVSPAAYDGARCVAPRENPMLVGDISITTILSPKIEAARAISVLIGVEGFLASWMGAQAMVYDGHLIAMVGQMSCGSNLDNFMTMRLMYLLAPMKDYGNFAVLYFNLGLLGTFLVLHLTITFLIQRKQDITFNDAAEIAAFPGWSYCCAVALHSGICYGTMQIAFHSPAAEAVASAGGFAYIVTVFVVIFYVLRRFARVAFVEYGFIRIKPMIQRFFLPTGYWDPKQPRRMFGRMLVTVGAGRTMYVPYQMLLLTGFSVITCVRPTTVEGCRTLFLVLAGGIFLAATQVAWWRPHRVPFQNFTTTITMTLLAIQCCLQGPSAADPTLNLDNTKAYMWIGQFVVIAIRGLFDTGLVLWENFMWGKHREPLFGVLDEDHFAGDDHTQAVDLYYGEVPPDMLKEDALYQKHPSDTEMVDALPEAHVTKQKSVGGRKVPPPPSGGSASVSISLSSPYQKERSYKDFGNASSSFSNRALAEDFGGDDNNDEPPPQQQQRAHYSSGRSLTAQTSLGRWEGSEGSLSSDDML
ncbi:membrane-associated protein, putative [Bodo saltans]|uniref:Membrane-associated protein, putative n=1 Tax=Bodo saltans TaxID=75058 RepID=A0A0S4JI41_BODSA|nr:membrane-associated protein, putative [Bodo saltans]|eukprot:CUG91170.1 membrane-associated protein, putative [Bodo saltans]